jgi:phosphodiesterase/alkaline phosphatase D-like protein
VRGSYAFQAAPGGWPLYVLDTRTGRQPRDPENAATATIIPDGELNTLIDWLKAIEARAPGCPKLIATPSVILPLDRGEPDPPRWSSDGWAGYVASRTKLLGAIAKRAIPNVIFLSGDAHLSIVSKVDLRRVGHKPVSVYSVVSSGLYAPWRFANATPAQFVLNRRDVPLAPGLQLDIESKTGKGDGFAVVRIERRGRRHRLTVELDCRLGTTRTVYDLP